MTSHAQRFFLATHITFSVGWLGAVVGFLALAVAGLTSEDAQIVRAAYLATELIAWTVILPACLGAVLTGLVQSLGTHWGLFKYYWVSAKFILSFIATVLLLLHLQVIDRLAGAVSRNALAITDLRALRVQLVVDTVGAIVVLLINTALSVYKPWGKTRYGWYKEQTQRDPASASEASNRKLWERFLLFGIIALVILAILLHLAGGGLGGR